MSFVDGSNLSRAVERVIEAQGRPYVRPILSAPFAGNANFQFSFLVAPQRGLGAEPLVGGLEGEAPGKFLRKSSILVHF